MGCFALPRPRLVLKPRKLTPRETRPSSMAIASRMTASSHHRVGRSLLSKVLEAHPGSMSSNHHVPAIPIPKPRNSKPQAFCGEHARAATFPSTKTEKYGKKQQTGSSPKQWGQHALTAFPSIKTQNHGGKKKNTWLPHQVEDRETAPSKCHRGSLRFRSWLGCHNQVCARRAGPL